MSAIRYEEETVGMNMQITHVMFPPTVHLLVARVAELVDVVECVIIVSREVLYDNENERSTHK